MKNKNASKMPLRHVLIVAFLCLWAIYPLSAQETVCLNGEWRFALAKDMRQVQKMEDFYLPDFNAKHFDRIPVPSNWAVLGYEEPVYRGFKNNNAGVGFYLHEFATPEGWNKKRVLLHFGGVWASAEVWLNGEYLGRHESGYTSFAFNVSGKLKSDGTNVLAVRVSQTSRGYKFDVYDDWTLGGIYRDVTLEAMPAKRWIDEVVTQTVFDNNYEDAYLKVRVMIGDKHKETLPGNYPSPGKPYELCFTLTDAQGNTVLKQNVEVPAHVSTSREIRKDFLVKSPWHWTAETPYLYDFNVELQEEGKVAHTRKTRIGFRQISTEGGVFRINGQAVKLRGVNRHDEHPDVGRATTRKHWEEDIRMMKAANINYIRASHYTPAKGFIELCDELGMYVGNEVSMGGAGDLVYDPSYYDAALQRTYETVSRDLNNPSIIYWSVGNEDPLSSMHMASVKLVKALDPTRPVLLPWRHEAWLPKEIDILAPHYWTADEYDRLAANSDRPIISTEYNHAFGNSGFGGLESRWKSLTRHPAGAGAAIWMWADQGIKTPVRNTKIKPNEQNQGDVYLRIDEAGWDGIVDSYRHPTCDYWEAKAVYAQVYPQTDAITFMPGQDSVHILLQNDFDFTNLSDVRIDWILWKEGQKLDSASISVQGQPHATAEAILPINKLKEVMTDETCYFWLTFVNKEGEIINRNSVELCPETRIQAKPESQQEISVEQDKQVTIQVGDIRYVFDPSTGMLVSGVKDGQELVRDIRPVIWHPLDRSDISIIGKQTVRSLPDMNRYTATVKTWKVEQNASDVTIRTEVNYIIDKNNHFDITYSYTINQQGKLSVHYKLTPSVQAAFLPIVGMNIRTVPVLEQLHWLGLGPYDAYPNKQSATILGIWGGTSGSKDVTGMKAIRRIEWTGKEGGIRISGENYMEQKASDPNCISVLSEVLGRPEKGRKSDNAIQRLHLTKGKTFVGLFSLELLP